MNHYRLMNVASLIVAQNEFKLIIGNASSYYVKKIIEDEIKAIDKELRRRFS
ncbi:hypothetical protein [Bacillus cereus]|uniref:hypothetical protein n=1 Tax=Bacillus cereus TaxID=1396 RepID=UPI0015D4D710|nr:hypothetical protein [Bacillus cereus]